MNLLLQNSTALVTAATDPFGLEIVNSLVAEGARVIVNGSTSASVEAALKRVRASRPRARVERLVADLATGEGCLKAIESFPEVDILVNKLELFDEEAFVAEADDDPLPLDDPRLECGIRLSRHYMALMRHDNGGRLVFLLIVSHPRRKSETDLSRVPTDRQLKIISNLTELTCCTRVPANTVIFAPPLISSDSDGLEGCRSPVSHHHENQLLGPERAARLAARTIMLTDAVAALITFLCSPRSSAIQNSTIRINVEADWAQMQPR